MLNVHQVLTKQQIQMKKIYLMMVAGCFAFTAGAQVPVTLNVDMSGQEVSPLGVHVAGNFGDVDYDGNFENPSLVNWSPNTYELTDEDGDMIYSISFDLATGYKYEFKFINGNDWPQEEVVPNVCRADQSGNTNRGFWVMDAAEYSVCYGACVACGDNAVLVQVDMSLVDTDGDGVGGEPGGEDIHPEGVFVAGNFPGSDWTAFIPLKDYDGDKIWQAVLNVGQVSSMEYKFINGPGFEFPNESISGDCGAGNGNRLLAVEANTVQQVYCWNFCDFCVQPSNITISVDMNNYCGDLSAGVNLMGTLTDWSAGSPMSDDDGDGVYTITIGLQPGNYEYKFRVGGNGWEGAENRPLTVEAETDQTIETVCFGLYEPCGPFYTPADITFRVNVGSQVVPSGQVVWVMGDFTGWQGGAIPMTDADVDGIWEHTIVDFCPQNGFYKFVIGANNQNTSTDWLEETADFSEIGGCGVNNGTFSDNRNFTRTSDEDIELCFTFDSCASCIVSVEENNAIADLSIYPVPATDIMNISFNNTVAERVEINVVNTVGQVVRTLDLGVVSGQRLVQLNVNDLAKGIYAIQITNGRNSTVKQVTVK